VPGGEDVDVVVGQQLLDAGALDVVVLDDEQLAPSRRGVLAQLLDGRGQPLGGGRLGDEGERARD
jgi:hypothetical protein